MHTRPTTWLSRLLALAGCLALYCHAEVSLPVVFADHMVIQRDEPVVVWGWDTPGQGIAVTFAGDRAEATAGQDGRWQVELPAQEAGGPFELQVEGSSSRQVNDILVGDVWLCSGQSNMAWLVRNSDDFEKEQAAADFPGIRHITVPRVPAGLPQKDIPECDWQVTSPETVGNFSAVAYFFGRRLHRELGVPVGLINSSWGGTRIEPWTPLRGFEQNDTLSDILERVRLTLPSAPAHKAKLREQIELTQSWLQDARTALAEEEVVRGLPPFPSEILPLHDRQHPTTLYNGMVNGLVPFAIRGAIWYQGESNHREGMAYFEKMKSLVSGWRTVWDSPEMPFYFVQIAPYQYGDEDPVILPELWEAQAAAADLPGVGMVVISDVGNIKDIHPRNKQAVGLRLANLALVRTHGRDDIVASGPTFSRMTTEDGQVRLHFDYADGGLRSRDDQPLTWFELHDAQGEDFVNANARIGGDTVIVSSEDVPNPAAVRFAWHKLAEPNLVNAAGLPTAPFRAGTVPEIDWLALKVSEAEGYDLVYDLDLRNLGESVQYDLDHTKDIAASFDRVAYFLELKKPTEKTQYVYVSMEAFTDDPAKIGIPQLSAKAHFQQAVTDVNVVSNVDGIPSGTGLGHGWIEFWPNNYGPTNSAGVKGASDQLWDTGDEPSDPVNGYGSMQVHLPEAGLTLFAINRWKSGNDADLGIGNSPTKPVMPDGNANVSRTRDWTFQNNASQYETRRLRVLVRPAE